MTDARPFARADYLALKAATRRACEEAGPLNEIVARTRVDAAQLSRYGNVEERAFVPVDIAMDLDRLAGGHPILRAWAQAVGLELVPHELHATPVPLSQHIPEIAREMSRVIGELAEPAPDSPGRATRIEHEAAEAIDSLTELQDDCRRVIAGNGSGGRVVKIS